MLKLEINPTIDFGKWATRTLEGKLSKNGWDGNENIELVFLEPPLWWIKKNKGPQEVIVPTYTFQCLVESVIEISKRVEIQISTKEYIPEVKK